MKANINILQQFMINILNKWKLLPNYQQNDKNEIIQTLYDLILSKLKDQVGLELQVEEEGEEEQQQTAAEEEKEEEEGIKHYAYHIVTNSIQLYPLHKTFWKFLVYFMYHLKDDENYNVKTFISNKLHDKPLLQCILWSYLATHANKVLDQYIFYEQSMILLADINDIHIQLLYYLAYIKFLISYKLIKDAINYLLYCLSILNQPTSLTTSPLITYLYYIQIYILLAKIMTQHQKD